MLVTSILLQKFHVLTLSQTTNFRLFQTERVCRGQFHIWWKWQEVFETGRIQWEKAKLLVTSNFSFSHSVFKRLALQIRKNQGLFGKGLSYMYCLQMLPFWTKPKFCCLGEVYCTVPTLNNCPFENIVGKEKKMLVTRIFSISNNVFYPIKRNHYFSNHESVTCFQFGLSQDFVIC